MKILQANVLNILIFKCVGKQTDGQSPEYEGLQKIPSCTRMQCYAFNLLINMFVIQLEYKC